MVEREAVRPVVLFLCNGNSARSQIAEAILKFHASDRFDARSAGFEPTEIHPLARTVLNELGIDMSGQHSKGLGVFLGKLTVHYAIIVCARSEMNCPTMWPWALCQLSWPFDDPAADCATDGEQLSRFRRVRDEIHDRIKSWLAAPEDQLS